MSRFILLCSLIVLVGFTSCVKTVSRKACFTFSNSNPKVNDTLYLFNCSEGYQKSIWYNNAGFYPGGAVIDSLQQDNLIQHRHEKVVVTAAGPYTVTLRVGNVDFYSNSTSGYSEISKTITVNP